MRRTAKPLQQLEEENRQEEKEKEIKQRDGLMYGKTTTGGLGV